MAALLFEAAPPHEGTFVNAEGRPTREYSSAASIVTQELPASEEVTATRPIFRCSTTVWKRFRVAIEPVTAPISVCTQNPRNRATNYQARPELMPLKPN